MNKRILHACVFGLLLAAGATAPVVAQERSITIAAPGGTFEQWLRKDIFPAFEAKTGIKINYVTASATDLLAKLQAQKGNQQIDVGFFDDGPADQAIDLGFCGNLAPAPVYDDLYEHMKFKSNKAVFIGMIATGIVYHKKAFEENRWAPPTSWADLADPKYRKKLVIFPLNSSYGVHALVMAARLKGGSEANIEPGFKYFRESIGPNVLVYEPSPAKVTELFQTRQALIAVYGTGRTKSLADMGVPVEFVYPKEGAVAYYFGACPIAGSKKDKDAQALIQFLLTPEAQVSLARGVGFGPANKTVKLSAEDRRGVPFGDQIQQLKMIDWNIINRNRAEWNKRWTREIER
ncbi:MAG: ABC transporter substrate-binding protein [Burkholderiaceae bacterium]